jgi:hypothetical protein
MQATGKAVILPPPRTAPSGWEAAFGVLGLWSASRPDPATRSPRSARVGPEPMPQTDASPS